MELSFMEGGRVMRDPIERQAAIEAICKVCSMEGDYHKCDGYSETSTWCDELVALRAVPSAQPIRKDVIEIPETGIGDLSDGYHTFNGLYEQRMILFAALVKAYKDKAWKSYRHEDGEYCFGGGWFIVGIDTPEGSYTYHYENKYWGMFDCVDLQRGKHWDGHTEADAETRLMSLKPMRKKGKWTREVLGSTSGYRTTVAYQCSECESMSINKYHYCPVCGAEMREDDHEIS